MVSNKFTVALADEGTLKKISGTRLWEVSEPFHWLIDYENKNSKLTVPRGFKTDMGSIPRILWLIFDPTEYISYCLHDASYTFHSLDDGTLFDRKQADILLYDALRVEGCGKIKAMIIYRGVRIGGSKAWNEK